MRDPQAGAISRVARHTRGQLFGVGSIADDLAAQWDQAIYDFQSARIALDDAETQLYNLYPLLTDADDLAEYQRLLDSVIARKTAMDAVAGAINQVADWIATARGWMGLSGFNTRSMKSQGLLGALGIAWPAFPISLGTLLGLVAAAVAISGSVATFAAYVYAKRDRLAQTSDYVSRRTRELVSAGVEPNEAAGRAYSEANETATAQAKHDSQHSFGVSLEKVALYSMIGLGFVFVVPKLLDMVKR